MHFGRKSEMLRSILLTLLIAVAAAAMIDRTAYSQSTCGDAWHEGYGEDGDLHDEWHGGYGGDHDVRTKLWENGIDACTLAIKLTQDGGGSQRKLAELYAKRSAYRYFLGKDLRKHQAELASSPHVRPRPGDFPEGIKLLEDARYDLLKANNLDPSSEDLLTLSYIYYELAKATFLLDDSNELAKKGYMARIQYYKNMGIRINNKIAEANPNEMLRLSLTFDAIGYDLMMTCLRKTRQDDLGGRSLCLLHLENCSEGSARGKLANGSAICEPPFKGASH